MSRKSLSISVFDIFKKILRKIEFAIKAPAFRIAQYNEIARENYIVDFLHEGSIKVQLPKVSWLEIVTGKGLLAKRNILYRTRPFGEVLLRKVIFELYETEYISKHLSIIDIGCHISDNTIVWSKYLSKMGKVIAIDPSRDNIAYGKRLATLNKVENIEYVQAVCADIPGIGLDFDGPIDQATFKKIGSEGKILSTTIDEIIGEKGPSIGLFHIDVEGFEYSVIKGAISLIERDLPVITFEQHISKENVSEVINLLNGFGYRVFMVNEVLPSCDFDCRNFLAFPGGKALPNLTGFKQEIGREMGIYSAVVGDVLIEIS